jgi:hypothetical protein
MERCFGADTTISSSLVAVTATPPTGLKWNLDTAWERADRSLTSPPVANLAGSNSSVPAGSPAVREMAHNVY